MPLNIGTLLENRICRQLTEQRTEIRETVKDICDREQFDKSELATAIKVMATIFHQTDYRIDLLIQAVGENLEGNRRFDHEAHLAEKLASNLLYESRE